MPLGFLIRRTGTEPHRVNRICPWSDKEGSDETSQPVMLSRSLRDPRIMSITSIMPPLQNVGSFPRFRISKLEEFGNSNRASFLLLQLVLPHTLWCVLELHPTARFWFSFLRRTSSSSSFDGGVSSVRRAGMQNMQPSVVLPLPHYTL